MRVLLLVALGALGVRGLPTKHEERWGEFSTWAPDRAELNGTMAIQALVERQLPNSFHNLFEFHLDSSLANETAHDAFNVDAQNTTTTQVVVTASSTSGLSRGLMTYLRSRGGDMYWSDSMFTNEYLATPLDNATTWTGSSWVPVRYCLNPVTFSYTMAWWDWPQWECFLDWASLHGVNMLLALVGQEYIWAEVYRDMGMSEEDILDYFAGPAFEAWARLGYIHGSWGGKANYDWIGKRWILQKQIVARMVALGITPVLPAFNGYVPAGLHQHIGGPEFRVADLYKDFPDEYTKSSVIDPTWDSWYRVQSAFLSKQRELYGGWTSSYYSTDLYHAIKPVSFAPDYLTASTSNVIASLRTEDPASVWVLSGGPFVDDEETWSSENINALLNGAGDDEVLVIDLTSEAIPVWNRTDAFGGKKWVWNTLLSYGQTEAYYGSLWHYASEITRARETSTSLHGIGLTMEGMNNNEAVFEMVLDAPWTIETIDPNVWVQDFAVRRYGMGSPPMANATDFVVSAWRQLIASAYNSTDPTVLSAPKSPMQLVPSASGIVNITGRYPTKVPYDTQVFMGGCLDLLSSAFVSPPLEQVKGYNFDMAQCARQVQLNAATLMYNDMMTAWNSSTNDTSVQDLGSELVANFKDIDRVLRTDYHFMFATWISDARKWSNDPDIQDFYEYQARNQIGLFGPAPSGGEPWATDRVASKTWAGVLGDYHAKNWETFVQYITETTPYEYQEAEIIGRIREHELSWEREKWGTQLNETWTDSGERLLGVIAELRSRWGDWLVRPQ